jgi:hypothetical protein
MKNKSVLKLTIIASIALISSCSIQKRTFRSGYHIEWNKKYETTKTIKGSTESEIAVSDEENTTIQTTTTATIDEKNLTNITSPQTDVLTETPSDIKTHEPFVDPSNGFNSQNQFVKEKNQVENNSSSKIESKKREKSNKLNNPPTNGGKLQIVALILCILLGLIGVHRFYLGYTGLGILYLFTLGLFGIGWLIDLILLIIPNGLTPKGRSNYKE